MPQPPEQIGPLRVHVLGGSDRRGGGDGPAIVLCHGFGAPGDDLVPLARVIDAGREVRWFFPEAPIALDLGGGQAGRAWWPIDLEQIIERQRRGQQGTLSDETPPGLAPARAALEATLAELERSRGVKRDQVILGGFSQGAMITTEIALYSPSPFAGLAVLSGNLLSEDRWAEAARASGPSIHALISHGRADPLLPFAGAEALRDLLRGAGASVEWIPHGGQHEIPPAALNGLGAFARARLVRGGP